jgi:hypothetical protein
LYGESKFLQDSYIFFSENHVKRPFSLLSPAVGASWKAHWMTYMSKGLRLRGPGALLIIEPLK